MSTFSPVTLSSSLLMNYYSAQLSAASVQTQTAPGSTSAQGGAAQGGTTQHGTSGATKQTPPWQIPNTLTQQAQQASVLSITNFIQPNTTPLVGSSGATAEVQADNQKLFTLYQAVHSLTQLAAFASQKGLTAGQLQGYNDRFQTGLKQVQDYLTATSFNKLILQAQTPGSSVTGKASVPFGFGPYQGSTIVSDSQLQNPLAGVSSSDSFTIGVTKGGQTTNVAIDLSQVQGPLTLDNIVGYVNQQLSADGFVSTFKRVMTSGSITDIQKATYGIAINAAPSESLTLSSADAQPALFLADTGGSTIGTPANTATGQAATAPDNQASLVKITGLGNNTQSVVAASAKPTSGTTTAQSTVVDAQGNVYVVGNATGNFGGQLNQGTQDVYLSKYDTAGNLQWSSLLGSAGSAQAYSLALDPSTGGVVVAGSTTGAVTANAVTNGKSGSFVAAYDGTGNQTWATQIPTLNANQANAVAVDANGNVTIGGQVTGVIGSGQTSSGGTNAYLATLSSTGKIVAENQFGPSGTDSVSAVATTANGDLMVASVQNGEAFLSKYAGGDITSAPVWQMDIGNLNGGTIGGIAVSGNQIYLSGTTTNAALTANGQASVAVPATSAPGNNNAFVFGATDNGTTASANTVTYVDTPTGSTSAGGLTVGPDGTVYLAGTTTGTFAGQTRTVQGVDNAFVASLTPDGAISATQQYGGADGQSQGKSIALAPADSGILDALGLPTGTISQNQSVSLTAKTTLRAGDSFQINTQGTAGRTATVTISQGESLQQLADNINSELLSAGKATVAYANGGETLQIAANAGNTINLIAGPANSDALGRLGIPAGAIAAPAKAGTKSAAATASTSTSTKQVVGLGFNPNIDLSSHGDATVAKISLQNVMQSIQSAYAKLNAPPPSTSNTPASAQSNAPASPYQKAQLANYSLALQSLSLTNSLNTTSSSGQSSNAALYQALLTA